MTIVGRLAGDTLRLSPQRDVCSSAALGSADSQPVAPRTRLSRIGYGACIERPRTDTLFPLPGRLTMPIRARERRVLR